MAQQFAHSNRLITSSPRSKSGLRGRTAIEMRDRPWGALEAIKQGWRGTWFFRCFAKQHEVLLGGDSVREAGDDQTCPDCEKEQGEK